MVILQNSSYSAAILFTFTHITMSADLNLTRDECAKRSEAIKVDTYDIALDLRDINDPETKSFASVSTISFSSSAPSTWLDLVGDEVSSVVVNGQDVPVSYDRARVRLDNLQKQNTVTVSAKCRYSRTGEGLHRFTDPADGNTYAYTHFEPTDARRVYACFEQPDLKGRITFTVTAPEASKIFSNQSPAKESTDNGLRTVTFNPTLPLSTYLTSIAVGPFHVVTGHWRKGDHVGDFKPGNLEIPLSAICRASMAKNMDADDILKITKEGLDFFDDAFKYPYPWGKYDTIFLPEYNIGAMEHPGLVTFNENVYLFRGTPTEAQREVRANTIMHEMTHMWFGDLVTPRWWDDTWLKESFADLMGYLAANEASGYAGSWVSFALGRKQWAYTQDQLPTTHAIVADVPDLEAARQNFDGITYAKGAAVLKQLMAYAGRDDFLAASQLYFNRHAFGVTGLNDLIECLKETSSADYSTWVPTWLETAGPSVITTVREGDKLFVETESVDLLTGQKIQRNHRVNVSTFKVTEHGCDNTALVNVLLDSPRVEVPLNKGTEFDIAIPNDGDYTYALLRFDDKTVAALLESVSTIKLKLTRAVAWSALWNMVRDATLPAERFLAAVSSNAGTEDDAGLLELILGQARMAIVAYVPPKSRVAVAENLISTLHDGLAAAKPSSDLQRTWANALASAGDLTKSGIAPLRSVLNGKCNGLELTPSLRWNLLASLACLGDAPESELQEEYARDSTMTGATALARAQACMPGKKVKQQIWDKLVAGDVTNDRQGALLSGFNAGVVGSPSDDSFVEPYFTGISQWWEKQTMVMATRLVRGLFPSTTIEDGPVDNNKIVKLAQEWLDTNTTAPRALRRNIIESLDGTRRQLRAQAQAV